MINGVDVTLMAGQIVGLIGGLLLLIWIGHKIDKKIRGKNNDSNAEKP